MITPQTEILEILNLAAEFEKNPGQALLTGYVLQLCFLSHRPEPALALSQPLIVWEVGLSDFLTHPHPAYQKESHSKILS
jgi:hypothetical protein